MALTSGSYPLGPTSGWVRVMTTAAGSAARLGHDLTLELETWSGSLEVDADDLTRSRANVTGDIGSLHVVDARNGIKSLSDKDRRDIVGSLRKVLQAERHPRLTATITDVQGQGEQGTAGGELEIAGRAVPTQWAVTLTSGPGVTVVHATGQVQHSSWGLKPYSTMLGQLKVADEVTVEVELRVPTS